MHVHEAIRTRRSIRAFTDQPVSRAEIEEILEVSQRAPSGTNTQPWNVWVCTGAVRQAITDDVLALARAGKAASYADYDYYPTKWKDAHNARRRGVGFALYGLLGIAREDHDARTRQMLKNFEFFGAPVGLFVTIDAYLARGNWADAGMYVQTLMLAARGLGLHTCPQAAWIPFQEPIYRHLGIPDDQVLITGMSLGHADPAAIENTLVSDREPMTEIARFAGFD